MDSSRQASFLLSSVVDGAEKRRKITNLWKKIDEKGFFLKTLPSSIILNNTILSLENEIEKVKGSNVVLINFKDQR